MNAWDRLHGAVVELTKGSSLKQRLTICFSQHLSDLDARVLPPSIRAQYLEVVRGLEAVRPLPGETAVQATVRKMSAEEANLMASRIVDLFSAYARSDASADAAAEAQERSRDLFGESNVIPLLYAAEA